MKSNVKLLVGSAVAAGVLAAASIGTAFAADPTPGPLGTRGPAAGPAGAVCQGIGRGFSSLSDALQKLAGISPEEVQAERQAGKSAVQIAAEQGVTEEALVDEVLANRSAALDEAVQAGRITQERADFMLDNMTGRITEGLNRTSVGPNGPRGGYGPASASRAQAGFGQSSEGVGPGMMNRWAGQGQLR